MGELERLAEQVRSDDPLAGLEAARALRELADRLEAEQVKAARDDGYSWTFIGEALGISRQAAHKKHGGGERQAA